MVMADRPKNHVRVGFYDIEKTIGKGNFAVVKLGKHRITKTEVWRGPPLFTFLDAYRNLNSISLKWCTFYFLYPFILHQSRSILSRVIVENWCSTISLFTLLVKSGSKKRLKLKPADIGVYVIAPGVLIIIGDVQVFTLGQKVYILCILWLKLCVYMKEACTCGGRQIFYILFCWHLNND